eukprot:TRINITY_DN7105_c0_g1_i5.p2 TRINITY_DN7105_c0_g1~~TRINITY_DN7105_c0_g1_i5.p2  ORF type:complete len:149 (-),score=35.68 TRINITY_DN7105_c0_g1_i5:16-462(-)
MSVFLVLPPLFWGVAAYTVDRAPEVTTLMHELGMLTLTTTDQFYIFQMVAITVVSLRLKQHDSLSAFPRWAGYFTAWAALGFEVGAFAFIQKTTTPLQENGPLFGMNANAPTSNPKAAQAVKYPAHRGNAESESCCLSRKLTTVMATI